MENSSGKTINKDKLIITYDQLFKDKSVSHHVEIQPGKFREMFWRRKSIYLDDDIFTDYVIDFIVKRAPSYGFYGQFSYPARTWKLIVEDMKQSEYADDLAPLIKWLTKAAKNNHFITIIGHYT